MIKEFTEKTEELYVLRKSEEEMRQEMERLRQKYKDDLAYNTKLIQEEATSRIKNVSSVSFFTP